MIQPSCAAPCGSNHRRLCLLRTCGRYQIELKEVQERHSYLRNLAKERHAEKHPTLCPICQDVELGPGVEFFVTACGPSLCFPHGFITTVLKAT